MDPSYFAHTLTPYEAELFLKGMIRRPRAAWEQSRYIAYYAAKPHCKESFTFESMGQFSWEKEGVITGTLETPEETEAKLGALRERARKEDAIILKKLNGNGESRSEATT